MNRCSINDPIELFCLDCDTQHHIRDASESCHIRFPISLLEDEGKINYNPDSKIDGSVYFPSLFKLIENSELSYVFLAESSIALPPAFPNSSCRASAISVATPKSCNNHIFFLRQSVFVLECEESKLQLDLELENRKTMENLSYLNAMLETIINIVDDRLYNGLALPLSLQRFAIKLFVMFQQFIEFLSVGTDEDIINSNIGGSKYKVVGSLLQIISRFVIPRPSCFILNSNQQLESFYLVDSRDKSNKHFWVKGSRFNTLSSLTNFIDCCGPAVLTMLCISNCGRLSTSNSEKQLACWLLREAVVSSIEIGKFFLIICVCTVYK